MKTLLSTVVALSFSLSAHADWQRLQGAGMSYWLYSPASAGENNPLMINLHGCGQKADDLKELGNWEGAAEAHHMYVAIPDVPNGGVVLGCWNYYGRGHTESNNNNGNVIQLALSLRGNSNLHIDPAHIYVSGLSSGATQAMLVGCLRPDIFHGVALNSGPTLGSEMSEISSPHTTAAQAAAYCQQLGRAHSADFATQKSAFIRSDQDFLVNIQHSNNNSDALAAVYGARSKQSLDLHTVPGVNNNGTGTLWVDGNGENRVAFIINNGLAHNWAAGNSRGGNAQRYVNPNSVDFPDFLATFFER
jgi:poly(3-hydroxybutyrate) depolymerase